MLILMPRLLAIVFVILILFGGIYYYFNYSRQENIPAEASIELQALPETNTEGDLLIKEDKIVTIRNNKEEVLFMNVKNVSQVKYGPDGKTVHFKAKDLTEKSNNYSCANIGDPIYPVDKYYPGPSSPTSAPWDYQKISSAGTISGCNSHKAGGFLDSKNYFAYIEITPQKKASLFLEDLTSNQKIQINLPDSLAADLSIDPKTGLNKLNAAPITGKNGNFYLYPQGDLMTDERLLVGIHRLLLTVNYKTKQILKDIRFSDQSSIVSDAYSVVNKNGQPYAVIVGAWEGPETYEKIIDISSDNVKDIALYPKYQTQYAQYLFKVDPLTWEKDRVELNIVGAAPVTKSLSAELIKKQEALMGNVYSTPEEWAPLNQEAVAYLKSNNKKYKDYACSLAPGMISGECYGLLQIDNYQYNSLTGFQKI